MDSVTFAMDLLCSNSLDEQLIGARILYRFSTKERFSDDMLRKIRTTLPVIHHTETGGVLELERPTTGRNQAISCRNSFQISWGKAKLPLCCWNSRGNRINIISSLDKRKPQFSLAQDNNATEHIGGTGGVLKELLKVLFQGVPENQRDVRIVAGEALAMLAFESKSNCHRILKLNVVGKLLKALEIPLLHVNAGRILRNLCTYSGPESFNQLKGVTAAAPTVLKAILSGEGKPQEVMVGLAVHAFKFMTEEESTVVFKRAGFSEAKLACALAEILRSHRNPHMKVPRMRRFAIELAIWMMREKSTNVQIFRDLEGRMTKLMTAP